MHQGRWEKGSDPSKSKFRNCAVRTQPWRLVNNKELFDIANDPFESHDVAAKHPNVIGKIRQAYDQWWTKTLPLMVNEDVPFAPEQPQTVRYEKQLKDRGIPKWVEPSL